MRKVKVLRVIARLNIGGPAIHAILLTAALNDRSYESVLVCGSVGDGENDMFYLAKEHNVNPVIIPELGREISFRNDLRAFLKLYGVIKREKPDIVHTHTAKGGTLGRLAALLYNLFQKKENRCRVFHTFHGHVFYGYFGRVKTRVFVFIERMLACFSDSLITVSESVRQDLLGLRIAGAGKVAVVRLGFDLDRFLNVPISDNISDTCNVGIVARLVPIKNHRMFLDGAAGVLKQLTKARARFFIYGDGEMRRELEGLARGMGLAGAVQFMGWSRDLPSVYRSLDIVASTSINEGTPVSLIEALAAGRAVIATQVGGVENLLSDEKVFLSGEYEIRERGVLVKSGDAEGFSKAVIRLAADPALRRKLGARGREYARGVFTKERLVKDIKLLYNNYSMGRQV